MKSLGQVVAIGRDGVFSVYGRAGDVRQTGYGFVKKLALCVLASVVVPAGADELTDAQIKFELLKGNTFEALVLMEGEAEKAGLDRPLALSSFGMLQRAREAFEREMRSGAKDNGVEVSHLAQYYLGLDAWYQGDYATAEQLLQQAKTQGVGDDIAKLNFYLADALLRQDKPTEAAQLLGKVKEGLWAAYAYYNLGLFYAAQDGDPSRAIISLRVADAMNPKNSEQALELLDNTNFAAGYLSLNASAPDRALSFLNRIRTEGEAAPRALYVHGVAHADLKNYRAAIQSWHRVKKYPLINSGVAETFMALPYAYEKEGYIAKAATSWLEAISVFDKESRTVQAIIDTIEKVGVSDALFHKSVLDDLQWFLADNVVTNSPKVAYQNYLMQFPRYAAMTENALQVEALIANLQDWKRDLVVFDRMLSERIDGYHRRTKDVNLAAQEAKAKALNTRLKALQVEFAKAEAEKDFIEVSAGNTQASMAEITALKARVAQFKQSGTLSEADKQELMQAQQRLETLEGVVVWSAQEQFERNSRITRDTLSSAERELSRYADNLVELNKTMKKGPDALVVVKSDFAKYGAKVNSVLLQARQQKLDVDKEMSDYAIEVLKKKRDELISYREKSEQALAHTYEYIAELQIEQAAAEKRAADKKAAKGVAK